MLLLPFLHARHFSVSSGNERFCAFVCWAGASGGSHDHSRGSAVHDIYVWQSPGSPGARCFGLCLIHQWFICHNMVRRMGFVLAVCVSRVITWWSILPCWWILVSLMLGLQMLGFLLVLTHFTGPLSAAALISFSCKRQIVWELLYFYNCTETERKEHKPGWFTCICSFSVARIHGFLLCRMFWCPLGAELVSVINLVPYTENGGGNVGFFDENSVWLSSISHFPELHGTKDSYVMMGGRGVSVFPFEWKVVVYGYQQRAE